MKNNNFKNDVIELYKKGLRPKTIADELAAKYNVDTHSERAFKNFKSRIRTCISRFNHSKDINTVKEVNLDEIVREFDKMVRESYKPIRISGKTENYDGIELEEIEKLKLKNKMLKADIQDLNRIISSMVKEIIDYIPGYFATAKEINEHTLCDFLNNLLDECQGE